MNVKNVFKLFHHGETTEVLQPVEEQGPTELDETIREKRVDINVIEKDFEVPFDLEIERLKMVAWEGQKAAKEKLRKALAITSDRFNIAIVGREGIGKRRTILEVIDEFRELDAPPKDLIALRNFEKYDQPFVLYVPQGYGTKIHEALQEFIANLNKLVPEIPKKIEKKSVPFTEIINEKRKVFAKDLEERVYQTGLYLVPREKAIESQDFKQYFVDETKDIKEKRTAKLPTGMGEIAYRTMDTINQKEFYIFADQINYYERKSTIGADEAEKISNAIHPIYSWALEMSNQLREEDEEIYKKIGEETEQEIVAEAFAPILAVMQQVSEAGATSDANTSLQHYASVLQNAVIENLNIFNTENANQMIQGFLPGQVAGPQQNAAMKAAFTGKIKVNILRDSTNMTKKPFIEEDEPTWKNLIGYVDRKFINGTWVSDFDDIRPGSLFLANDGYLRIKIKDIFTKGRPFEGFDVWQKLINILTTGKVELEHYDPAYTNPIKLKIPAVPIRVRVLLQIDLDDYLFLAEQDENFINAFKVAVEFNTDIERNKDSFYQIAAFINNMCEEENLNTPDVSGYKEIARHASRMVENRNKYSLNFERLADIIREAHTRSQLRITAQDIQDVLQDHNSSLIKEKAVEARKEDKILIHTAGEKVGEINALAVFEIGKSSFGLPYRVTVNTNPGDGKMEITDLEGKSNLAGSIYKKGFGILISNFKDTFSQSAMKFNADIVFEQSYSGVDGDSASLAIYCALISSLSGFPILQQYAVTGRISQKGEVGPIGGVNQKIEGFFRVCKEKGLTGDQGVIIPAANVADLVLDKEIVQAIKDREFHIFRVHTVEEAIEILTGVKAGKKTRKTKVTMTGGKKYQGWEPHTVYAAVQKNIEELRSISEEL